MDMRHKLVAGIWLVCSVVMPAQAADDLRMQVDVVAEEGESLDLQGAIKRAAGIMWDRVLPQAVRKQVSDDAAASLLMRAVPGDNRFEIEFQAARVWQFLDAQKLPLIRQQPQFNLQLLMLNEYGVRMQGSESAMQAEAATFAQRWGIGLTEKAPLLTLSWQWLGANQVQLNVRGNSRYAEQSETRTLTAGDPMEALKAWMDETLLHARDAYSETDVENGTPEEKPHMVGSELMIHINRQASLAEQVLIEEELEKDRRVLSLQPRYLGSNEREYTLKLATTDDSWVPAWFSSHGMSASATAYGWLVQ